ncbi:MAG TPA: hypothetical protein VKC34_11770 [Blastocatellia bacterium]|nr:hypothetical protein [Blastocatellia bacterium]
MSYPFRSKKQHDHHRKIHATRIAPTDAIGFDPEAVETLHKAYTEACNALRVFSGDRFGKEAIAARVIDLAKTTGVLDAKVLRDRVLLEAQLAA